MLQILSPLKLSKTEFGIRRNVISQLPTLRKRKISYVLNYIGTRQSWRTMGMLRI